MQMRPRVLSCCACLGWTGVAGVELGHCKAPDVSLVSAQTLLRSVVQLSCHLGISFVSKGLRLYFGNAALRFPRVRCSYLNKKNRTAMPRTHYQEATGRLHSLQTPPTLHRAQAALLSCSGCQRLHFGRCSSGRAVPGPCPSLIYRAEGGWRWRNHPRHWGGHLGEPPAL